MNLELSGEQIALRDTLRRVLADNADPRRVIDDELSMVDSVIVAEEMGRALYEGPGLAARIETDDLVIRAADALGAAQAVFELAVEYAKVREQFGQPIGAFQAVQHLCVDMYETIELVRGGVLYAAWAADVDDPERAVAAWRLKAYADRLVAVGDTAIQVFGGIGFTWEHDAHRYLRRLMAWSAHEGPPTQYRQAVARALRE